MKRLVCCLVLPAWLAMGQPRDAPQGAPVLLDGKELYRIRTNLGAYFPNERAASSQERLERVANSYARTGLAVEIRSEDGMRVVVAAGVPILTLTPADARAESMELDQLARLRAEVIRSALNNYVKEHRWSTLFKKSAQALGGWALFVGAVILILRGFTWAAARLQIWFGGIAQRKGVKGMLLLLWERLLMFALLLLKLAVGVIVLVQLSVLLTFTLSLFPATSGISISFLDTITHTLDTILQAVVHYLPNGVLVIVAVSLAHYLIQAAKLIFRAIEREDFILPSLAPDMAMTTYQLVRAALWVLTLIVIFPYLPGSRSEAFKGVSIFLGVVLSLGSGSAMSNVLAGIVLTYMRPFKLGDYVRIVEHEGDVVEKGMLVTRLRTIKNVEVTIPNATVLSAQIQNFSALAKQQPLIVPVSVTIGYDVPWRTVHALLIQAAMNTEGILPSPAPFVLQTSLNDFHISYQLNAYTNQPNRMADICSTLHAAIQDSFNKSGVEIMSPTYLAVRDGNTVTVPEANRPPDYSPPGFRLQKTE